jgi:hypothetical protein
MADDQMSAVRRLDMRKLWVPIVAGVAVVVTAITIALLLAPIYVVKLLHDAPASASSTPFVAAEQTPAGQVPSEPAAPYQNPDDPPAAASAMPQSEPARQPGAPPGPEDSSPSASEQRVFKSRKALETLDARDIKWRGTTQK